jgi:hypothetical protein
MTQRLTEYLRALASEVNRRLSFGERTIYVPAHAMTAETTAGPASSTLEVANKVLLATLDFDSATAEYAQFSVQMPRSWDLLPVRAKFLWAHATATASTSASAGVVWRLQAQAFGDGDSVNAAFSTAADVADIGLTALTLYDSGLTASYTVASAAASDWVVFRVSRQPGEAGDTFSGDTGNDAKLIGVSLIYAQSVMSDVQ